MDKVKLYRQIIKDVFTNQQGPPHGWENAEEYDSQIIFDNSNDHYLLMDIGWKGSERMLGITYQLDIKDDKIWVQQDNSDVGIVDLLLEKGVPKEDIVLAFHAPYFRKFTEFAIGV